LKTEVQTSGTIAAIRELALNLMFISFSIRLREIGKEMAGYI
jgi:hypothetical protein